MNKKLLVVAILAILLIGGVWAYFATRPNTSAPQTNDGTHSSANDDTHGHGEAVAGTEIIYTDNGFSPANLAATKGMTITIKNNSSGPLDFSSDDHPTHTKHPEFNLTTIAAGGESKLELKTAGVWGYHNHLKASDTGMITIAE